MIKYIVVHVILLHKYVRMCVCIIIVTFTYICAYRNGVNKRGQKNTFGKGLSVQHIWYSYYRALYIEECCHAC